MTITKADIKLVKSQVLDDVPEGGNGPTNNEVVDGASNDIFPDISESDRAAGRVNVRKVHVWIQSNDRDTFLGGNVIVAQPPNDPNVSITLMSTGETFDVRSSAVSRIEAYLNVGPTYRGFLYNNHIAGQAVLAFYQRTSDLPPIGATLALTKFEGLSNEQTQYVRITEASSQLQTFTDSQGDFSRYVLTLKISDPLRYDFPGFDVSRIDPTKAQMIAATRVSETVVTDAAKYAGVSKLAQSASVGDFSVKVDSIFTQLVPSAQVETPIIDSRTNQVRTGLMSTGRQVTAVASGSALVLGPNSQFFVGGAIVPGSFEMNLTTGNITFADDGQGFLTVAGARVGTIDYANGVVVWLAGAGTSYAVNYARYTLGAASDAPTQSVGQKVTIENRSISFVRTLPSKPLRGSMTYSYMAQGRWYVLVDNGDGNLRGTDSAYGAGQINFTTDTINVTMGALPDVGSSIIVDYIDDGANRPPEVVALQNSGKLYLPVNSDGDISEASGSKSFEPGQVAINYTDGGARTSTDDGNGNIVTSSGGVTGTVNYAKGTMKLFFSVLPPKGTVLTVTTDSVDKGTAVSLSLASGVGSLGVTNVTPGSVELTLQGKLRFTYLGSAVVDYGLRTLLVTDDGNGKLRANIADTTIEVGTINYTAGTFAFYSSTNIPPDLVLGLIAWDNLYVLKNKPTWTFEAQ